MAKEKQSVVITTVTDLARSGAVGIAAGCRLVGLPRSTYYRITGNYEHYKPVTEPTPHRDRHQPAALTAAERSEVVAILERTENSNLSVVQIYWRAIDIGEIACSQRTFYRIADHHHLVGDRRRGRHSTPGTNTRPAPCALATRPNELWSWDITELHGPTNADRYKLYLAIDVFSRYPVAWRIEYTENRRDAVDMFTTAIKAHATPKTIHSDNGAIMRSHQLIDALTQQKVTTSFSRPRVSDDNPFSESLFKTLKYDLSCPEKFDSIDHARLWTEQFLHAYATEHRHSGLNYYTPEQVYTGTAATIQEQRRQYRTNYYDRHPERFRKPPQPPPLPGPTGINPGLAETQNNPHLSQTG